jgi:hypothetical protein
LIFTPSLIVFGSFMLCLTYFVSFCDTLFRFVSFLHFSFRFVVFRSFSTTRNRQTSGESASLPQYLGCNTVFDMHLSVTFLRRKTVVTIQILALIENCFSFDNFLTFSCLGSSESTEGSRKMPKGQL